MLTEQHTTTNLPINIGDAQRRTVPSAFQTTEVELNQIINHAKGASKNMNLDREYSIDRNFPPVVEAPNMKYVIKWYGYTEAEDTLESRVTIPLHLSRVIGERGTSNTCKTTTTGFMQNRAK